MNPSGPTPDWQTKLKSDIGENPARFLDQHIPRNPDSPGSMFIARVRGIDHLEVIGAWQATERRLAAEQDREPRSHVMEILDQRRQHLLEHGERSLPELTAGERRERARELFEATEGRKPTSQDGDKPLSASAKLARMRSEQGGTA